MVERRLVSRHSVTPQTWGAGGLETHTRPCQVELREWCRNRCCAVSSWRQQNRFAIRSNEHRRCKYILRPMHASRTGVLDRGHNVLLTFREKEGKLFDTLETRLRQNNVLLFDTIARSATQKLDNHLIRTASTAPPPPRCVANDLENECSSPLPCIMRGLKNTSVKSRSTKK